MQNKLNWIIIIIIIKIILYYWLLINGLPKFTSDSVGLQGPAAGFILNNTLNAEIYKFKLPYASELIAYPSGYIIFSAFWFKIWGVNIYSAISLDMFLELLVSILLSYLVFLKTKNHLSAGLIIILSTSVIHPLGRPELLAILILSIIIIFIMKNMIGSVFHSILIGLASGLAMLTAPISSFCFLLFTVIWLYSEKVKKSYLFITTLITVFSLILTWGITIGFDFKSGFIQLSQWGNQGYSTNFLKMVYRNPIGNLLLLLTTITNLIVLSLTISNKNRNNIIFISYIITSVFILSLFKRLEYDYRQLTIFNLTSIIICSNKLKFRCQIIVIVVCLISVAYSLSYNLVKPSLVAMTWRDYDKYDYNKLLFNKLIPKEASIGGSGNLWTFLDDGRYFYSDRYIDTLYKPDYMIYRGFNSRDSLKYVIVDEWKTILSNEYILINNPYPLDSIKTKPHSLWISKIFNVEDTDFRFRIWKKKSY